MSNEIRCGERLSSIWQHIGSTPLQKSTNITCFISGVGLTAMLWRYIQPSSAILSAGATVPLIALGLKTEDVIKDKEIKKGWV